ncbi:MAG: phosphotransferase [Rhodobacter sp.]|nr:phosphotransferase [Rhodobacter sp.]
METPSFWIDHFTPGDEEIYNRFIALRPADCFEALEEIGAPRIKGVRFESPENRVFGFGDLVLKFFRPDRWSLDALKDELQFLEDLRDAEVPFVRPVGKIGTWRGIHYLAFHTIPKPYETDPKVLKEPDVRKMVHIVAKIHEVGALRDAHARPRFDLRAMCDGSFEIILRNDFLPKTLRKQYKDAIDRLADLAEAFGTIPLQRIHGDSFSGNALWRPDGPVFMDLDDFQMGPTAMDIPLLSFPWRLDTLSDSMDRKERRVIQHRLVLDMYRQVRPFEEAWEPLIPLTRGCRNVLFDAWLSARWNEPGFNEIYEDDDLMDEQWWSGAVKGLERAAEDHLKGWP